MGDPYRNPNYPHQPHNPNIPQQPGQYIQPGQYAPPGQYLQPQAGQPYTNTYGDPLGQQAYPHYPPADASLQPQPLGRRASSRSPNPGHIPFPVPEPYQGGPAGHPQAPIIPSPNPTYLNLPTAPRHERRGSHGSATGSSDGRALYPTTAVSESGGFIPPQQVVQPNLVVGGGYAGVPPPQPQQDWDAGVYDEGNSTRAKGPPGRPASNSHALCRFPHCTRRVIFDRRVNEFREWCSDQHMQAALARVLEKPCSTCHAYPRRNGHRHCSEVCRFRGG